MTQCRCLNERKAREPSVSEPFEPAPFEPDKIIVMAYKYSAEIWKKNELGML
jgi:hypothetical protein